MWNNKVPFGEACLNDVWVFSRSKMAGTFKLPLVYSLIE